MAHQPANIDAISSRHHPVEDRQRRRIRPLEHGQCFVAITGDDQEAGADDYLTKPFARAELRARIEVGARVVALQKRLADRVEELNQALAERERADESLRLSESRYRHLVEHSLGLIYTHDLNGKLLSVNPAAARLWNTSPPN